MKVILSRKGFDITAGGVPSPILPDGTLLSFPIPARDESLSFDDLSHDGVSYAEILRQLRQSETKENHWRCHLDPDLRPDVRTVSPREWRAAFGQVGSSQSYLANQGIGVGDLFLFFGWFRQTEGSLKDGNLRYVKGAPDLHVIFAYLQVGEVITNPQKLQADYAWHPHAAERFTQQASNALYVPSSTLSLDETKAAYGTVDFDEKRVLTMQGCSRATWKEVAALSPENVCRQVKNAAKNGGIYYMGQWQELVLVENELSQAWVREIL